TTATGLPSTTIGWKRQVRTAAKQASASSGGPFRTLASRTEPSSAITYFTTTTPSIPSALAAAGYSGVFITVWTGFGMSSVSRMGFFTAGLACTTGGGGGGGGAALAT